MQTIVLIAHGVICPPEFLCLSILVCCEADGQDSWCFTIDAQRSSLRTAATYRFVLFSVTNRNEITQLAERHSAVNLHQGVPDFSPPKFLVDAFCRAVSGGPMMHQYTRPFVSVKMWPRFSLFTSLFVSSSWTVFQSSFVAVCVCFPLIRAIFHSSETWRSSSAGSWNVR